VADNTTLDPGTGGDTIATDDIGGVKYQRVKLVDGTADSATAIGGDATNGLDVDVTRVQGTVTVDSELAAAAALADAASNPTTSVIGSMLQCYNGTTWDRARGDITNGLDVDVTRSALPTGAATAAKQPALGTAGSASTDVITVQGIASGTVVPVSDGAGSLTVDNAGTFAVQIAANSSVNVAQVAGTTTDTNSGVKSAGTQRIVLATDQPQLTNALKVDGSAVTQPVSGTVTANLGTAAVTNAGTFAVQDSEKIADDAAFTVATTKLTPIGFLADQTSTDSVNEGDIGAARITLDRKLIATLAPSADTEGLTVANNIDVDESEDAVKTSAGKLYGWFFYNDGASEVYIKYYNDTVANVVVGTTTPFMTIPIPAGSASNIEFSHGIAFSGAITIAATTAATTADTGAPATNQVVGFSVYQ
jgi:hypothetical protein